MTARNEITGDALQTKVGTDSYRSGWDRIFGKKPEPIAQPAIQPAVPAVDAVAEMKKLQEAAQAAADAERLEWWMWLQKNQANLKDIPHFEAWKASYKSSKDGNTSG